MKFLALVPLLLSVYSITVAGAIIEPQSAPAKRAGPTQSCANPTSAVPWRRYYNQAKSDHQYFNGIPLEKGWTSEGTAAYIFSTKQPGTVALYKAYSPSATDHFYTTSEAEYNDVKTKGYTDDRGIAGYIYPDAKCGGVPLYRHFNPTPGQADHFYTTSKSESDTIVKAGWSYENEAGYVLPYFSG